MAPSTAAIAIKTMDRTPGRNYLERTLRNLHRAGVFSTPRLRCCWVVDSGSPGRRFARDAINAAVPLPERSRVWPDWPTRRRTLQQNAARAIGLAGSARGATWALVLEDDIDVCADFLEGALAWLDEHAGWSPMYALAAAYDEIQRAFVLGRRSMPYPVQAFYGAQALAWPAADAQECAEWLGPDPDYRGVRDHGHDLLLQVWGRHRQRRHFLACVPSLVQHVGEASGIDNRFFGFTSWPGRAWRYPRSGVIRVRPPEPHEQQQEVA